ncbi:hypothetical protein [Streptomyces sp. NPDC059909]|uniref:hypothetical protein n=1 Tax=Streptomyces sp. NPDC059909 TaxID=3346998 RepID=UPI00365A69DF
MAALSVVPDGGQSLAGTGRVTLLRTGGGAAFGAYALLYTTRPTTDGGVEAIVAATRPEDTDPAWQLHRPQRHGPQAGESRPLTRWAAALEPDKRKSETQAAYNQRLAQTLIRIAHNARSIPPPGLVDLPLATWEITTDHLIHLAGRHLGHTVARIGRLVAVEPKEA